jgi:hypothetical protein
VYRERKALHRDPARPPDGWRGFCLAGAQGHSTVAGPGSWPKTSLGARVSDRIGVVFICRATATGRTDVEVLRRRMPYGSRHCGDALGRCMERKVPERGDGVLHIVPRSWHIVPVEQPSFGPLLVAELSVRPAAS